jgi:hypothetical protein
MSEEYSKDIQNYVKSKLLQEGDQVTLSSSGKHHLQKAVFKAFPEVYRGRLVTDPSVPGVEPGKYIDRSKVALEACEGSVKIEADIDCITLDPITAAQRQMTLGHNYHFINLAPDKIADLPETTHMEGDIVALTDKDHPNFSTNLDNNQFTVYRVYYETAENEETPTNYRLRAGKLQFDATEDQIRFISAGPVRLFYSGEGFKLLWPSVKEEAEFHLLLGRFNRIYNPTNKSYSWDLEQAQQVVNLGKAHGVLQHLFNYYLVNFWDDDIGCQLWSYSDLILDI